VKRLDLLGCLYRFDHWRLPATALHVGHDVAQLGLRSRPVVALASAPHRLIVLFAADRERIAKVVSRFPMISITRPRAVRPTANPPPAW
jgi:hypothetical protein